MDDADRTMIEWARAWAQAMENLDAAVIGVRQARESNCSRDRLVATVNHQRARADLTETEIALLDAVRATWARRKGPV